MPLTLEDLLARRRQLLDPEAELQAVRDLEASQSPPPAESLMPLDRRLASLPPTRPVVGNAPSPPPPPAPKEAGWWQKITGRDPNETPEQKYDRLDAMRSIGEGFGGLGQSLTDLSGARAAGFLGPAPEKSYISEGIRQRMNSLLKERQIAAKAAEEAKKEKDEQTFQEAQQGRAQTFQAGEHTKNLELNTAAHAETARHNKAMEAGNLGQEKLDLAQQRQNLNEEVRKRLSDHELNDLQGMDSAIQLADSIMADKPQFDTGPASNAFHTAAGWLGMSDPQKAEFKARINTELNQVIRNQTGAVMSRNEANRIISTMPTMNDNDEQFTVKMKGVIQRLHQARGRFLDLRGRAGKTIEPYKEQLAPDESRPGVGQPGDANRISVQKPDGSTGTIPAENWPKAEAKGWKKL